MYSIISFPKSAKQDYHHFKAIGGGGGKSKKFLLFIFRYAKGFMDVFQVLKTLT